ncbi:MAG: PEP-CTERM sorting domain-containing protein [Pirellulaceae bacterium]|nr:PEP-CTERM sorting domain-containing protein [Pirellulaceae bacterium]
MKKCWVFMIGVIWAASVHASPTGISIGLNFGADEPNGGLEGVIEGPAGVVGTANWNNLELAGDIYEDVFIDANGTEVGTGVEVEWASNNTWSSDGRGEANNSAPAGNDRALMLGYLDTSDTSITEVSISNLPSELSSGFDVFVYVQGGVNGRGGTYTLSAGGVTVAQDNLQTGPFDGTYIEGEEGNYLVFPGLSGDSLTVEAQATTPDLFRAALNGIEICAPGACLALPTPVAGRGTIGDQVVSTRLENPVYGPGDANQAGLAQAWYAQGNPGSKAGVDSVALESDPAVPVFRAGHGATWWTGSVESFGDLVKYPEEIAPAWDPEADNNDTYTVKAQGELLVPESGSYRFTDGVDDFTYLAIDIDKSGVAGDNPDEILIDDNNWTTPLRDGNNGGGGYGEADFDIADGGEWLAIEVNIAEGGGGDSGVIYWDYDANAPAGQRLGGAEGFPEFVEDPLFEEDAENMFIPDSHLRSSIKPLLSGDLVGELTEVSLGWEFEIDGDTDKADRFVLENKDENVYTTMLDVDGVNVIVNATGDLQAGDAFQIIDADQITGTPVISSSDPSQEWSFNAATGQLIFGAALTGDYNGNGLLDADDLDLQASVGIANNDLSYDLNDDGVVNSTDRRVWVNDLKNTWMGDANLNGAFDSSDLVAVFATAKYETTQAATWGQGDWDGNGVFDSGDLVEAFSNAGYNVGEKPGGPNPATAAVPEPSSILLLLIGSLMMLRLRKS